MNNKGVVLSSLIYALLVFFLTLIAGMLMMLQFRQAIINKQKYDASKLYSVEEGISSFDKTFGGSLADWYNAIQPATDGYVVVGYSKSSDGTVSGKNRGVEDGTLIKYNYDGDIVWNINFGGTLKDEFYDVVPVSDGYIAVGYSSSSTDDLASLGNMGATDALIVKFDLTGTVVWKDTFGGTSNDEFSSVKVVSDGIVTAGFSASNDNDMVGLNKGSSDAILVKYDFSGNKVWQKVFGGSGLDRFYSLDVATDRYTAVGWFESNDQDLAGYNNSSFGMADGLIVQFDTNQNVVWKDNFGGLGLDWFGYVKKVSDGYVALGGFLSGDQDCSGLKRGFLDPDALIVKYDLNGSLLWKKSFGGTGYDEFYSMYSTGTDYIVVGYSGSTNYELSGKNIGGTDGIRANYDVNGNLISNKNYGGTQNDQFYDATSATNGNIYVGGSFSNDGYLYYLNRGSSDGWYEYELNG